MASYEVVIHSVWVHTSGRTASMHGALPWGMGGVKEDWALEARGFTVFNPLTGQYGTGRPPFETRGEADTYAATHRPSSIGIGD